MFCKWMLMVVVAGTFLATNVYSQASRTHENYRIALDHDGNSYDKDDVLALAMNYAIITGFGMQQRLVHVQHSTYNRDTDERTQKMIDAANGWKHFPGFDSTIQFSILTHETEAIANFKKVADRSTADYPLSFICAGPMEYVWKALGATSKDKRKLITCVSHSSWNENFNNSGQNLTHTWSRCKSDFSPDGVTFIGNGTLKDQNCCTGGGSNWSWCNSMTDKTIKHWTGISVTIPGDAYDWVESMDYKANGDCSDAGMTWYWLTGDQEGRSEDIRDRCQSPLDMLQNAPMDPEISIPGVAIESPRAISRPGQSRMAVSLLQSGRTLKVTVSGMAENGTVRIFDLANRLISTGAMRQGQADCAITSPLSGKMYIVQIQASDQQIVRKVALK